MMFLNKSNIQNYMVDKCVVLTKICIDHLDRFENMKLCLLQDNILYYLLLYMMNISLMMNQNIVNILWHMLDMYLMLNLHIDHLDMSKDIVLLMKISIN